MFLRLFFISFLCAGQVAYGEEATRQSTSERITGSHQQEQKLLLSMQMLTDISTLYHQSQNEAKRSHPKKTHSKIAKNTVSPGKYDRSLLRVTTKTGIKQTYCLGRDYEALAKKAKKYQASIVKYSRKYGVSESLIKAIITAESCFNAKAVSPKGAQGLMQLMPPTAKRFGVTDSFNTDLNIKAGTNYLKFLLEYFEEDILHAIAAYNAGEGAVDKYKGIPPYKETRQYVTKVAALYKLYSQGTGVLTKASVTKLSPGLAKTIFVPRALPKSRFSPYKDRARNIEHGQCANRTGTRLRKSTRVESGNGIWQRVYIVQKGDTLMRVMQKTGVHKHKIMQMNGLRSRARLKAGQELLVWECRK